MRMHTLIIGSFFTILFVSSTVLFWLHGRQQVDEIIAYDVSLIAKTLMQIDQDCTILSFEHEKNFIDFLNVISFYGSEVGPINLAHPENWRGPYLEDNPTMQEKYYQVLDTKDGYYVVPGPGVQLSNGLVIGENVQLDRTTNIQQMIAEGILRSKEGKNLVKKFTLKNDPQLPEIAKFSY